MSDQKKAQLKRQLERFYPLRPHPVQQALMTARERGTRFCVVPAGRRSGKTEIAKRMLRKSVMQMEGPFYAAAPTREQAKKIWWKDLKDLTLSSIHPKQPNESELIIYLPNGSELHVIGLDRPERFEGIPWLGGVVDEIANCKPTAINENILPALDTEDPRRPGYKAWGWFIGVPEGFNHFHDMVRLAPSLDGWEVFHWKSAEILSPETVAAARARMSAREFRQEYEASFEGSTGRIYEDYSADNHAAETIQPHERLLWAHDFNYTPLSSCISVRRGESFYVLDEIVLESAVARQSAMEFVEKFSAHQNKSVVVYGDPAGRAGEKHGHQSSYTEIETVLRQHGWSVVRNVSAAAPLIKDRQNALRYMIKAADGSVRLYVNPARAPWSDKALATTQFKAGSAYQEDQSNKYQHMSTAIGYMAHRERNKRGGGIADGVL